MQRNKRIEKINAFQKLLDSELKKVSRDEEVQKEIQDQFLTWVSAQLDFLMGNETPEAFTADDIAFLKAFVNKAKAKATGQSAPTQAAPAPVNENKTVRTPNPGTERNGQRPRPQDDRPIGDRLRNRKNMSLEDLENEGPEY